METKRFLRQSVLKTRSSASSATRDCCGANAQHWPAELDVTAVMAVALGGSYAPPHSPTSAAAPGRLERSPVRRTQFFLKVSWKVTMVEALPAVNVATPSLTRIA